MNNRSQSLFAKRYILQSELGAGGMGIVYRALDRLTGQTVALKQVLRRMDEAFDDDLNERNDRRVALAREFQMLASLRHPHIISVLDYGFDDFGQPFFTMPLLQEARDLMMAGQSQPIPEKMTLLIQTLQALAYLHRRGILHRDLKPANVLVVEKHVRLLDFGLAQDRDAKTQPAGTLAYMAPELFGRGQATEASDLYAMGIMAYEMLVGRHPYDLSNPLYIFQQLEEGTVDFEPLRRLIPMDSETLPELPISSPPTDVKLPPLPTEMLPDSTRPDVRAVQQFDLIKEESAPKIAPAALTDNVPPTNPVDAPNVKPAAIPPEKASVSDHPLTAIVQKMMLRNPALRYQDAQTVIPALCKALNLPTPEETIAIRESFLQAARLVGRDAELKTLLQGLEHAIGWESSGVLIGGESGVGKSRLMDELRIRALVLGALVSVGQAVGAGSSPYQVWREPLRRLILGAQLNDVDAGVFKQVIPDLDSLMGRPIEAAPALTGETAQSRLTAIVGQMIKQQDQPVVIILEDLHWAGSESLVLVNGLLTIPDLPLLIVGSYRDDELPDLPTHLPALQVLKLPRLPESAIRQLSESILGAAGRKPEIVEFLQRETEGNVFFLVEIVRALAEGAGELNKVGTMELPETVAAGGIQRIVQCRLARVPADLHPLLKLAAVAGRELDLKLLTALIALPEASGEVRLPSLDTWLITCAHAAVLEVSGDEWRFAHDKLRDGVLAGLTSEELKPLHRTVARTLESLYNGAPEIAPRLAYHWGQVEDIAKEAHYAELAGDHALNTSAYRDALTYLERAMALTVQISQVSPEAALSQVARLKYRLGRAHTYLNNNEQAETLFKESLALARRYEEPETAANALRGLGVVAWQHNAMGEAIQRFTESLTLCQQIGDKRGEGRALSNLANTYSFEGDIHLALPYYERALAIQRQIGDRLNEGNTLGGLGAAYRNLGEIEKAIEMQRAALAILEETGDRRGKANTLTNLGVASFDLGQMQESINYFQQAVQIFREIGDRRGEESSLLNMGTAYHTLAQFERAGVALQDALTIARALGDSPRLGDILSSLGEVCILLGRQDDAVKYLEEAVDLMKKADETETEPYVLLLVNLGRAYLAQGDFNTGGQMLSVAYFSAEKHEFTDLLPIVTPEYAKAYLFLNWWQDALNLIEAAREKANLPDPLLSVLFGIANAHLNNRQAARDAFDAAIAASEALLAASDQNYQAFYACGLACTGLAFLMPNPGELLSMAGDMYMVGRDVCGVAGVVREQIRLLDLLDPLDYAGVLPFIKQAMTQ